jgi:hypothetical protein
MKMSRDRSHSPCALQIRPNRALSARSTLVSGWQGAEAGAHDLPAELLTMFSAMLTSGPLWRGDATAGLTFETVVT